MYSLSGAVNKSKLQHPRPDIYSTCFNFSSKTVILRFGEAASGIDSLALCPKVSATLYYHRIINLRFFSYRL